MSNAGNARIAAKAAFRAHAEVGRGRRNVAGGEGMLTPSRPFTWQGQRLEPDRDRFDPRHEICHSEFAHWLRPAYEKEAGVRVQRFLERVIRDHQADETRGPIGRPRLPRSPARLDPPRLP
jgi:hypothetical protein